MSDMALLTNSYSKVRLVSQVRLSIKAPYPIVLNW